MATEELVDIAPHVNQIVADLERQSFEWVDALGELIDNSLDAGASRITVEVDKRQRRVVVSDDGNGCAEPHRMFVSGDSIKRRGQTTLGRYGVGLKHASYYFAKLDGTTTIVTSHQDAFRSVRVCWQEIVQRGAWKIDPPIEMSREEVLASLPDARGTCIAFRVGRGRGFLAAEQWEKMLQTLAFTFSPALRAGRQIRFAIAGGKPKLLALPRDPSWSESVEFDVEIEHRKAHVRAGLLAADDKSGRRGLSYGFAHRVILQDTQSGCGDFSTEGFAGFVDLDHHWQLGQNKSQVTDEAWDQLVDAIYAKLRPLLEKLRNSTQHLQSEALRGATASMLNQCFAPGTGQAKRPGKPGTKREEPAEKIERKVRHARIVDGIGSVLGRRRSGGRVNVQWEDLPDAPYAARVDQNGQCIYLNKAKHMIAEAIAQENSKLLGVVAAAHLFSAETRDLMFGKAQFADLMGQLLGSPMTLAVAAKASA